MKIKASPYIYPLWHRYQSSPDKRIYNTILIYNIKGNLEVARLTKALEKLTKDHYLLNSHLIEINSCLYWERNARIHKLSVLQSNGEKKEFLNQPFDLAQDPLYRFGLFKKSDDEYEFIIVMQPIVLSRYAINHFLKLVSDYYNQKNCLSMTIKDQHLIIQKNNKFLEDKIKYAIRTGAGNFWKTHLYGLPPKNELYYTKNADIVDGHIGQHDFEIEKHDIAKDSSDILWKKFLINIWGVLIAKYSNSDSAYISYHIGEIRSATFLEDRKYNTSILPIRLDKDLRLVDLMSKENADGNDPGNHGIHPYYDVPIDKIINLSGIKELNVSFLNTDLEKQTPSLNGCTVSKLVQIDPMLEGEALSLAYEEKGNTLKFRLRYQSSLFSDKYIKQIARHYVFLLQSAMADDHQKLSELPLLSREEYKEIVYDRNCTDKHYTNNTHICQLFESQAAKTPENIAVVFENQMLTYQELNDKANQFARYLRKAYKNSTQENIYPDALIGLCLNRSIEMIIAILGVLKAGGAYIPIDPNHPSNRINYILMDSQIKILIIHESLEARLRDVTYPSDMILVNLDKCSYIKEEPHNLFPNNRRENNIACVFYTSGTTGSPKGAMITHRGIINRAYSMVESFDVVESDRYIFKTNYAFDVSILDIFMNFAAGASIRITKSTFDITELKEILRDPTHTFMHLLPFQYDCIAEFLNHSSMKKIYFSGEALSKNILLSAKNIKLYNCYGSTEAGDVTVCRLNARDIPSMVGKCFPNNKVYILDSQLRVLPMGIVGELYVGGVGLSIGYLNKIKLTTENFIANPFATKEDKQKGYDRLYKTGDLVRWLPDGNLEYIGRNDFQVKIRGFRIELGEIENALTAIAGIKQSCVLAKEKAGNKYLVAYYVADKEIKEHNILDQLSKKLPDYMLPSALVKMDSFPLTINGKLDRKALPEPELTLQDQYIAPITDLEIKLCGIWQEVLELEKIGITDDFFRIGGHSILAIKLSHQISQALETHIAVADIFKYKTISSLADYLESNTVAHIKITPQTLTNYPLSFAQERLWFIEQYEQGTNAYHIPLLVELQRDTDSGKLKRAIQSVAQRHEILRTVFKQVDGVYTQVVMAGRLKIHEYSHLKTNIDQQITKDIQTPFNLGKAYPIRVCLYYEEHRTRLLINMHHVASDGWSEDILLKEIYALYDGDKLAALPIQYKDFAVWQRDYLQGEVLENQLDYWQERLTGYETLNLPTDKVRPKEIDYTGSDVTFEFDVNLSNQLRTLSKQQGCTLYATLLSGFYILLGKYSGQEDIVLGTPIANRHYAEIQDLIGFFVNSLALREKINQDNTIIEFIAQVQDNLIAAQQHQDLPFEKIVEALKVEKDTSRHPIFQVMFGVQTFGQDTNDQLFSIIESENSYNIAKFDLECFMDDSLKSIRGTLNFATSLYEESTIIRMVDYYKMILTQMVDHQDRCLKDYTLLIKAEYQQIVVDWNKTDKDYPKDKTITQLFEAQVAKTPDNIAVVFENKQLSYAELNTKANQLARYLQSQADIKPDTLIALCLDRSLEMIIGILGIMKVGGAYVPIDPEYPAKRIQYILDDTQTETLLTQSHLIEKLENITKVNLIALDSDCYIDQKTTNLPAQSKASDLAYVIYTSGTTGQPKGVMVEHKQFSAFILNFVKQSFIDSLANFNVLSLTNYTFDIFGLEFGLPLSFGNCIYLADFMNINQSHLQQSSIIQQTPHVMNAICDSQKDLLKDKLCLVGGEHLPVNIAEKLLKSFKQVVNVYGPSETVIWSSCYQLSKDKDVSIGHALFNEKLYVLDPHNKPVPIGVTGELYIGGAGLARGYLNRPALTEQKFINNPFATQQDKRKGYDRLYKTGDLVRWLPDGNLEYIGRNDFQVKIRGFRIELGEIDNALIAISGIKQACVLAKEKSGNKYLVAYYVTDKNIEEQHILDQLAKKLPDYMLPSALVKMDSIPLTINGKLDRKALPDPEFTHEDQYVAPTTDLEIQLCEIWQEVLGLEKVSLTDDFFRIGGHSILAIKLSHQISQALETHIAVADIFKHKTISSLADYLKSNTVAHIKITPQALTNYPLSFAQERLWFIEQYEQGTNAYHIPLLVELHKSTDISKLKAAIQFFTQRHEVLRTVFKQHDGVYYQVVLDDVLPINEYHAVATDIDQQIDKDINTPFNLEKAYPIRVCLYYEEHRTRLLINMHHVASDGWSEDILLKELNAFYEGETLSDLPIQYKDFAVWQRDYLQGEVLAKQLDYWQERLTGYETLNLPTDKIRPKEIDYTGSDVTFAFDVNLSNQLRDLSKQQGCTLYATLLSGFYILLGKYSGQADIVLGTPIANRHYAEIQDLIGFFVNSLALREKINQDNTIIEFIAQVQDNLIAAQRHQDLPFEKIVDVLNVAQDTSRHPIFQVMFGVQTFGQDTNDKLFRIIESENSYNIAKFDLECFMDDSLKSIRGIFNFATSLYEKSTITRMVDHYTMILAQMVNDQDKCVRDYTLLTKAQYQQIVVDWNKTDKDYPKDKTITQLFEAQVAKTPNNIAVVFEDKQLTYAELNAKANQLARYLRLQAEIKPDTLIALCIDRSLEMIIGILGILKAGGAYVPIDPEYPAKRIQYILDDTKTAVLLTQSYLIEKLQNIAKVNLVALDSDCYQDQKQTNLPAQSKSTDLAYVIYTSGTTGQPKGVMVEHVAVASFAVNNNFIRYQDINVVAGLSSFVFDGSIFDLFVPILSGKIYIMLSKHDITNLSLLFDQFNCHNVDTVFVTTALLNAVVENNIQILSMLKQVLFGGEHANIKNINIIKNKYPDLSLIHVYGPTETVVYSTFCHLAKLNTNDTIPIGKGLNNKKHYILDKYNQPAPQSLTGELHIGGAGLARGYLNRPALTEQKFINNPFATQQDKQKGYDRLYKTGDLVRWLPDGNLEYIGRNDFQVKIRGFRIELGEIENALTAIYGIKQSCVLAKEKAGNKYLVAYYIADKNIEEQHILDQLGQKLPDYMVPSTVVKMDSFPLTVNGKLDSKALPDPEFTHEDQYVAPTTDLEIQLCEIWQEVLNLEKIGITDDFFRIGGHSILAIKLTHHLNQTFKTNLSVADIFKHKTIASLAQQISGAKAQPFTLVKPYYAKLTAGLPTMIMIHPGFGGSEVYQGLADKLSSAYNCVGIDNYNMYFDKKISSLPQLAQHYLDAYERTCGLINEPIYLLGWSLGGQIALEMAYILEQRGCKDIHIYLLDTVLQDAYLINSTNHQTHFNKRMQDYWLAKGYEADYVDKILQAAIPEAQLIQQQISGTLCSKVTLFKALQQSDYFYDEGEDKIHQYIQALPDNNIGQCAQHLKVVNLACHHWNIVEHVIENDQYLSLLYHRDTAKAFV